jgi:DNA topoisomerase-1
MSADPPPASLVYVDDSRPGWRRERRGEDFAYFDEHGRPIRDEASLARVRRLAIPPAYEQVWICPLPNGHLQATGRDARGRKQYRYHPEWHAARDTTKYERLRAFGMALPRVRRQVERDLALRGLPREKVLATVVRLLDTTYLRVGNDEYARSNGSYGLTTLRNRHAAIKGATLTLSFRGKSGVAQKVRLDDPRVARICAKLQELPGQELFQWVDDAGEPHAIGSADVNDYLRRLAGDDFSAKDFRTWHASALTLERLLERQADAASPSAARRIVNDVIDEVASRLGHTRSVCRKAYVHPAIVERFEDGGLATASASAALRLRGLKASERALIALLSRKPRDRTLAESLRKSISASGGRTRARGGLPTARAPAAATRRSSTA